MQVSSCQPCVISLLCRKCKTSQPVGDRCINSIVAVTSSATAPTQVCTWNSTYRWCSICNLWNDDTEKNAFHCDECGICRAGKREAYIHCGACGLCLLKEVMEKGHTCCVHSEEACCICFENLRHSVNPVILLNCSHAIHDSCYYKMLRTCQPRCPICRASVFKKEDASANTSTSQSSESQDETDTNVSEQTPTDDESNTTSIQQPAETSSITIQQPTGP